VHYVHVASFREAEDPSGPVGQMACRSGQSVEHRGHFDRTRAYQPATDQDERRRGAGDDRVKSCVALLPFEAVEIGLDDRHGVPEVPGDLASQSLGLKRYRHVAGRFVAERFSAAKDLRFVQQ
jgi:hypothetical protein